MVNSGKLFRAAVYDETLALPEAVKMKEVWQHVLAELEANFLPNEELLHAVPVTNSNSHLATSGLMGLTYAKKTLAKNYVTDFASLRGNRALLFTNQRLIFVVVLDFLEDGQFFTYPYPSITSIYFKRHKISALSSKAADIRVVEMAKAGQDYYYYLDFESDNHYFTEIFSPADAEKLFKIFHEIPGLKNKVNAEPSVYRKLKFDRVWSNPLSWLEFFKKLSLIALVLGVIVIIKLIVDYF